MTDFQEIFERIVKAAADAEMNTTQLAVKCEVSPQRLFNWRRRGVPPLQVAAVSRAVGGVILPHQIRPDLSVLFPPPIEDGELARAA